MIGQTLLMEDKSNCEDLAIKSFKRGKRILEHNLAVQIKVPLEFFDNNYDKQILNDLFYDSEEVKDLKNVVKDMWGKVSILSADRGHLALAGTEGVGGAGHKADALGTVGLRQTSAS